MMSDSFRVVQVLHKPSPLFSIYDYTKIAYLTGSYICIRDMASVDTKPTFVTLDMHIQPTRIFQILSFPNCLVLAEKVNSNFLLHFYQQRSNQTLRVPSQMLVKTQPSYHIRYQAHRSNNYIYILVHRQSDIEILVVDYIKRIMAGRAFVSGLNSQFRIKGVQDQEIISLKTQRQVTQYQVVKVKPDQPSVRLIQRRNWHIHQTCNLHCWSKEELIIVNDKAVSIFVDGKSSQVLPLNQKTIILRSTISGFIVVGSKQLKIFKKNGTIYELSLVSEMNHICQNLQLSPQEDFMAFYCRKDQSIYYSFDLQKHQNLRTVRKPETVKSKNIIFKSISHNSDQFKVYPSRQNLFFVTNDHVIQVFSTVSYKSYLTDTFNSQAAKNTSQSKRLMRKQMPFIGENIVYCASHPSQMVVAVAFRSVIRLYYVLYNQLKLVKELQTAHSKQLGFSNAGGILYAQVSGRQGSKVYLFSLPSYQQIQILYASRPLIKILFSKLDNTIYGIHSQGYYSWYSQQGFKQRQEYLASFKVQGAQVYGGSLLIWGKNDMALVDSSGVVTPYAISRPINSLMLNQNQIIVASQDGFLYNSNSITNLSIALKTQGFKTGSGQYLSVGASTILWQTQQNNLFCFQWGIQDKNPIQIVSLQRKRVAFYQNQYQKYEQNINNLAQVLDGRLILLKYQFTTRQQARRIQFQKQIQERQRKFNALLYQKMKLQQTMQQTMQIKQQQTLRHVKQLEKIYQRKMAITTNKLLTAQEIGFRNEMIARQNLSILQHKQTQDIQAIRNEYSSALQTQIKNSSNKDQLLSIKRNYQTKLSELERENQNLVRQLQGQADNTIVTLKKNQVTLQLKLTQTVSQKYNLQQTLKQKHKQMQNLKEKVQYLLTRLSQQTKRGQELTRQRAQMQQLVANRQSSIGCLQKRIMQLEKSNQIFRYRIVQMKSSNDPKEQQILRLKQKMMDLQQENDKITMQAHQLQTISGVSKKQSSQLRQVALTAQNRAKKIQKNYLAIIDRVRQATKAPIQEIRKLLLKLLQGFDKQKSGQGHQGRSDSPLAQLNRIRDHLQTCFHQAVQINKKSQKQKEVQLSKKNQQNSQLLGEINQLRVQVKQLQTKLRISQQRQHQVQRQTFVPKPRYQKSSTLYQSETHNTKRKTKESFLQRSMFKGVWRGRLRTEGGNRKKSVHSLVKNDSHLHIQSRAEDPEQLKRLLQQKQTIIKQLINKIHKLS